MLSLFTCISNFFTKKTNAFSVVYLLYFIIYIYILSYIKNINIYIYIYIWLISIYMIFFNNIYTYNYIIYIKSILFFTFSILTIVLYIKNNFNITQYICISSNNILIYKNILLNFTIDNYSVNFIILTSLLGGYILLYSYDYMKHDLYINRFVILLNFFILSMLLLLMSSNYLSLILGWELIGITSYFLINFWYTKPSTNKAAFKAFFFNKLSDVGIIIFCVYSLVFLDGNLFSSNYYNSLVDVSYISKLPLFFLIVASFCKSAQIGFHVWLPDSMEAPIPASALIHSATLVSAGIYICGRYSSVLNVLFVDLSLLTSFTALYGAVIASCQTDAKKILAYSTISHCGYLFFLVFLNKLGIMVVYLYLHGFFKALAFTTVGFILSKETIYQDFRYFGGFSTKYTFEYFALPAILLNLAGLPFFFGFFSKFLFIGGTLVNGVGVLNNIFLVVASICGFVYSSQLIYNFYYESHKNLNFFKKKNFLNVGLSPLYLLFTGLIVFISFYIYIILFNNSVSLVDSTSGVFISVWKTTYTWFLFYKLYPILLLIFYKNLNHINIVPFCGILFYVFF